MPEQSHLAEDRVDAAFDDRTRVAALVGVNAQEMLCGQLNRRERILDLMGDLPRHLGPRLEPVRALELDALGLELASHAVERVHQAAQLVDRSHGNAGVEIAAGDALRRSGQAPDRVGNALGERQADGGAEEDEAENGEMDAAIEVVDFPFDVPLPEGRRHGQDPFAIGGAHRVAAMR